MSCQIILLHGSTYQHSHRPPYHHLYHLNLSKSILNHSLLKNRLIMFMLPPCIALFYYAQVLFRTCSYSPQCQRHRTLQSTTKLKSYSFVNCSITLNALSSKARFSSNNRALTLSSSSIFLRRLFDLKCNNETHGQ